jgi:hypothetical protein
MQKLHPVGNGRPRPLPVTFSSWARRLRRTGNYSGGLGHEKEQVFDSNEKWLAFTHLSVKLHIIK